MVVGAVIERSHYHKTGREALDEPFRAFNARWRGAAMNAWRMIVVSTGLVPVIVVSGCGPKQPEGQYSDRGRCFQQAACTGGSLLQDNPPTLNQCKVAGGRSWSSITQTGCTNF